MCDRVGERRFVEAASASAERPDTAWGRSGWRIVRPEPSFVRERGGPFGGASRFAVLTEPVASAWAMADALTARGRHADGGRVLQAAAAAARRRGDAAGCGVLWLGLGRARRLRGHVREAERSVDEAREAFQEARLLCGTVACLLERSWLAWDDDCFDESAGFLRAASEAATRAGDGVAVSAAGWAAAHLACWDGRVDEAQAWMSEFDCGRVTAGLPAVCESDGPSLVPGGREVRHLLLPQSRTSVVARVVRARAALEGGGRHGRALPVTDTEPHVEGVADRMAAYEAAMLECAARGGREGVLASLDRGLREARLHHAPLLALSLRLTAGECTGGFGPASGGVTWGRWTTASLPALYRRRLKALSSPSHPAVIAGTGGDVRQAPLTPSEVVSLIRGFSDASDEHGALERGCEVARQQLGALAVSAFALGHAGAIVLANAGGRGCDATAAVRAMRAAGAHEQTDAPAGQRFAVVTWAGEVIGVVGGRWSADGFAPGAGVAGVLAVLASLSAVSVRALQDPLVTLSAVPGPTAGILGRSQAVEALRRLVERAGATPFPVLILGESGTGKELTARAIHLASERRSGRFCAVNCAALSEDLLEAELFGHARGAFTGAAVDRPGLFEEAGGGTLFLDEIGELSPRGQAKVLRAIQEREVRRVGENHYRRVDVRLVTATNRALADEVRGGRFREDLYYRLDVVRIEVPALRSRAEDIPLLAERFWKEAMAQTGGRAVLAGDALAVLARRPWPGNVRELQNTLAALAVRVPKHGRVGARDLAGLWRDAPMPGPAAVTLNAARREFETGFVRQAIARAGGRRGRAAADLGLTRQGLSKLVARLGLDRDQAVAE